MTLGRASSSWRGVLLLAIGVLQHGVSAERFGPYGWTQLYYVRERQYVGIVSTGTLQNRQVRVNYYDSGWEDSVELWVVAGSECPGSTGDTNSWKLCTNCQRGTIGDKNTWINIWNSLGPHVCLAVYCQNSFTGCYVGVTHELEGDWPPLSPPPPSPLPPYPYTNSGSGYTPTYSSSYPSQTDNSGLYGGLGGGGATCLFIILIILRCCCMGIACNQTCNQAPAAASAAPVPDAQLSPAAATVVQHDSIMVVQGEALDVPDIVVVKGEALPSSSNAKKMEELEKPVETKI